VNVDFESIVQARIADDRTFRRNLRRYFAAADALMERYGTPGFLKNTTAAIAMGLATLNMMKRLELPDALSGDFTEWLNGNDVELDDMLKAHPDPWWRLWR
jgi:hypothetical protein